MELGRDGAPRGGKAVLLMAYGSPQTVDEILPYYTHMRGGRPPSPAALEELQARYRAIGGTSPLQEITQAQARGLESVLKSRDPDWRVAVGMKHSPPFIEEAVTALQASGAESIVGLVLAPHYSQMSVGEYRERAGRAAGNEAEGSLTFIDDWHLDRGYVAWLAERVKAELEAIAPPDPGHTGVIFTAHSLPARLREMGDPYPDQLEETAAAVAAEAGLTRWTTGWQSVAQTGEPWLGPELEAVMAAEAAAGMRHLVVCACGFTADHLEILYDIDLEAQQRAAELGVTLRRTPMPNDDPEFIRVLADLIWRRTAGD